MTDGTGAGLRTPQRRLALPAKVLLLARVWVTFATVHAELIRNPLARAVVHLSSPPKRAPNYHEPMRLSRAVSRGLRIGPWQPRCLIRSLVLYRLLRAQGDAAELVIGLPNRALTSDAHAWIELLGRDVGPPPGRWHHQELVRYPQEPDIDAEPVG